MNKIIDFNGVSMDISSNVNTNGYWWRNFIAKNILTKKYYHDSELEQFNKGNEDEAFKMFVTRVSSIFSNQTLRLFMAKSLYTGDYILAGRSLYGAGAKGKFKSSMSNCYILDKPNDNIESIFDVAKRMARIFSFGGGCGIDISNLRPANAKVNNVARTSTGAVSFMNLYSAVGETIAQNSRRGALLIALDCNHPDIEEFLTIKQNNDKVQGANISIKFTDEFMMAVKDNQDVELYFKVNATGEEITKTINAKEFFMKFCEAQYDYAEPGAIFIDSVRNWNLLSEYEDYKINVSNPCVTGDTLILTDKGNIPIKDLVDKEVIVWNGYEWSKVIPKVTGHNQPIIRIAFSNGSYVDCTPYHKFVLKDGTRVEAKNLQIGDKLTKYEYPTLNNSIDNEVDDYYTAGFYCGDGTVNRPEIVMYGNKQSIIPYLQGVKGTCQYPKDNKTKVTLNYQYQKDFVPSDNTSLKNKLEYLAGLCDSDGTTNKKDGSLSITSVNKEFLQRIQLMLTTMGIKSNIGVLHQARKRLLPTHNKDNDYKEYQCQTCYRLSTGAYGVTKLVKQGFNPHRIKCDYIPNRQADRFIKVTSIENKDMADTVYCMNEPINHTFIANGVLVGNCSEFFGNSHNSCNLSSVNLYNFVSNPFTDKAEFNYIKFKQCLYNAVYIANEVLDYGYDTQPLDENRTCIDDWRSIGIGVFGLADMFVALGIEYGSQKSKDLLANIMNTMNVETLWASSKYAKKYKPFGKYNKYKTLACPYLGIVHEFEPTLYEHIEKYGLANGTILSIAPTGSIAMLFRESGGVEPYYKVSYERTTHQLEKENKKFFISMLAVEDMLKHHKHTDYSEEHIKKAFPFVVDTYDIKPKDRIDIQAIMQKYVDNAISSTINLKEKATVQDIYDLYMYAWKRGCKGITIFRDNCKRISILGKDHGETRDGKADTVISEDSNKSDMVVAKTAITENNITNPAKLNSITPIKRGNVKSLWGRTFLYHTACVPKFYVTVNIKDNEIFEVFVGVDKGCQANISTITRMTSLALRSGVTVDEIVKNLNSAVCPACTNARYKGDKTIAKSCASCIASAIVEMQKTLNDGKNDIDTVKDIQTVQVSKPKILTMNIKPMMKCPECGEPTLVPDGKCAYCSNCGYSKCD